MNASSLLELLTKIQTGKISAQEGVKRLSNLEYEDLGFAKIDHHRALRTGMPEVIYAANKTDEQVEAIFSRMASEGGNVLATRVSSSAAGRVLSKTPQAVYHDTCHVLTLHQEKSLPSKGTIAVLCAGTSDLPVAEEAYVTGEIMGHSVSRFYDIGVAGIHRLLAQREAIARADVLIVCAGMEGALPSVVAGLVRAPVIAVPTSIGYGAAFGGLTALLGMLNSCSPNIGVVNIDNGFGAAALAHAILNVNPLLK